jgi:hypothetical protein
VGKSRRRQRFGPCRRNWSLFVLNRSLLRENVERPESKVLSIQATDRVGKDDYRDADLAIQIKRRLITRDTPTVAKGRAVLAAYHLKAWSIARGKRGISLHGLLRQGTFEPGRFEYHFGPGAEQKRGKAG